MQITNDKIELDSLAIVANGTFNGTTTHTKLGIKEFILFFQVSGLTDGSYVAKLQHSPDDINWFDLQSTSAVISNSAVKVSITDTSIFPQIRSVITASAVTIGATSLITKIFYIDGKF